MTRERPRAAAPKGKAKTLRQKDRIRTGLRKVRLQDRTGYESYQHTKGATVCRIGSGNLSGLDGGRKTHCVFLSIFVWVSMDPHGIGALRILSALTSPLFLEVHKVHLRKSVIVKTQILSQFALAAWIHAHPCAPRDIGEEIRNFLS